MGIWQIVKRSLNLLSPQDRKRYTLITIAQMSTALFDLIGVFTLGLTGLLSLSYLQNVEPSPTAQRILTTLHLGDLGPAKAIGVVALTATAMFILKGVIALMLLRKTLRFLASRSARMSASLTRRMFKNSLLFVQARSSQEASYALAAGVTAAVGETLGPAVVIACEIALLTVLTTALMVIAPVTTLGAMVYFALIAFIIQKGLGSWTFRASRARTQAEISSTKFVQEAIGSYREITVADKMDYYIDGVANIRMASTSSTSELQYIGYIPKYALDVALMLGASLLGAVEFVTKDLNTAVTTLALFLTAGTRVMPSLLRLQAGFLRIRTITGTREAAFRLINDLEAEDAKLAELRDLHGNDSATSDLHEFSSVVDIANITVTYPQRDQPALNDVSFSVTSGESLAIVGPSGAGKSTIADILLGVISPDHGSAHISGVKPSQAVKIWPGAIGYVPQTVGLMDGSIRRNVAIGLDEKDIDDDRVWEALEKASLAEFIRTDGLTLDSPVGERGVRLSGGQRQRLGLARALYTRPKLLVLDEATSALDAETEHTINQVLLDLAGSVTLITIAHRLATVRRADKVVYLEDGQILATGTFEQVREAIPGFDKQAKLLGL
jgi:ABC-type multidrug transport system fused ATPase/permease subunit